jgi:very-short-patch-repair endonuclease
MLAPGLAPLDQILSGRWPFVRRGDLLSLGYTDGDIRTALAAKSIFRVRHGWYARPDAPEEGIRAIRLGGRLTGVAALAAYGLMVPRRPHLDIAVPRGACRLRSPLDRRARLAGSEPVRVHWTDLPRSEIRSSSWRVPVADALVVVLASESREVALACCSAVMHHRVLTSAQMDAVFARAPARVRAWRDDVNALDESHGETFVRLRLADAGIPCTSQKLVPGVGRIDFQLTPNVYVEVDGAQHDPGWTGTSPSSWENDHTRDTTVVVAGGHVLRWTYRQLYRHWAACLAAARRATDDDLELAARRLGRPAVPRVISSMRGKRRRSALRDAQRSDAQRSGRRYLRNAVGTRPPGG